jgi:thiol-disulfide isomerase/thioredoxin
MKQFLPFVLFLSLLNFAQGQIISGDKLTENIVATDLNGNTVDIFADLDAGKTVVLDVFATWCGPCWSFHQSGFLKQLNGAFGSAGTDQVRIYAIEADATTPLSDISQASSTSWGDWTEGVDYAIINDHTFNNILKIAFFPTLYIIRPDRTVMEMGDYRFNLSVWNAVMFPRGEKDIVFPTQLATRTFCTTSTFNQRPTFLNTGTEPLTSISGEFLVNGESKLITFSQPLGVFESATLNLGTTTVSETTDFEVVIDAIDDIALSEDFVNPLTGKFVKPVLKEEKLIVRFTTDFYPVETSWKLRDNKNRTLLEVVYTGPEAGGGDDANKTFTYEVDIEQTDINCLRVSIADAFGDGLTAFGAGTPTPGVEFLLEDGTVLKELMNSDYDFTSTRDVFTSFDITSSLVDQEFVQNLSIYPSPTSDLLYIDMLIKEGTEYDVFVTDIVGSNVTKIAKNVNFMDVSALNSGMYFLNVRTKAGVFAHKFTKI